MTMNQRGFLSDRVLAMQRSGMQPEEITSTLIREGISIGLIQTAVFSLVISGRLRPANAVTEIAVQDAAEAVRNLLPQPRKDGLVSADALADRLGVSHRAMRRLIKRRRKELEKLGTIVEEPWRR